MNDRSDSRIASDEGRQPLPAVVVSRCVARLAHRYAVDRQLGVGGMGIVYLARDVRLGRAVAIKVLHPEVASRIGADTFIREIRLTAALQHPHILPVLDSGCVDGVFYYITPYLAEGSLQDLLQRRGSLSLSTALCFARDVLEALHYSHAQGIVHCDIKPENILLSNGHAVLCDYGIARSALSSKLGAAGQVSGSPGYMSPEQAAGERNIDGRSDLYSLACVLHELLTGEPAFTGPDALAIITRRFRDPAPTLSAGGRTMPSGVTAAIGRALSVDPADRFTTAAEFEMALVAGLSGTRKPWLGRSSSRHLRPTVARLARSAVIALTALVSG